MDRCHSCSQVVTKASWTMEEFSEAMRIFRREYLNRWAEANNRTLDEAHEDNRSLDSAAWQRLLAGEPDEPVPPALRAIATSRPRVAWLCQLPRDWRRWWRAIPHGPGFLARTYPEVTDEEWQMILPQKHSV